jgi:hypothetical protein
MKSAVRPSLFVFVVIVALNVLASIGQNWLPSTAIPSERTRVPMMIHFRVNIWTSCRRVEGEEDSINRDGGHIVLDGHLATLNVCPAV